MTSTCRHLVIGLALWLSFTPVSASDNDATRAARIHHFLEVSGGMDRASVVMSGLANKFLIALREARPGLPARAFDILHEEFTATWQAERTSYLNMLTPIYLQHYSAADIEKLIAFHESPVGVKQRAVSATLSTDASSASREWGLNLGNVAASRALERLRAEGIELPGTR